MKLYCAPKTISVAAVIALHETGLDFEPIRLDFASGEQTKPAYHAVNPKGRVPALVTDDGVLTETGAILEYVATLVPDKQLVPASPVQAALMRSVMYYLASTMHVNHAHKRRGHRWADSETARKDMTAKVPETMTESCRYIVENALSGPFVLGETFSIADPYLYTVCSWLEGDGVVVDDFPKIGEFRAAMQARSSVQRAIDTGFFG